MGYQSISHIKLSQTLLQQTLSARITDVHSKLIKGEDFEKVANFIQKMKAKTYVSNNLIKGNDGDLGYFSVLNLYYEFENAVYKQKLAKSANPLELQLDIIL